MYGILPHGALINLVKIMNKQGEQSLCKPLLLFSFRRFVLEFKDSFFKPYFIFSGPKNTLEPLKITYQFGKHFIINIYQELMKNK